MTNPTITDADLKPCPFCGSDAAHGRVRYGKPLAEAWWSDGSEITEAHYVNCVRCGASNGHGVAGGYQTPERAAGQWNTRHREEAIAETREELDAALDAANAESLESEDLIAEARAEIARLREALWRCKRLGERHAEIMLNPERTGHWKGADRTAQAFLGIAKDAGKALTKAGEV